MELREAINKIIGKSDRYQTKYWSCYLSDNCLELTVNNSYLNNRENYRLAVIYCGKALKGLHNKATGQNCRLYIQTIPDLHKSYLVAVVRILESNAKYWPGEIIPESSFSPDRSLDCISSEYADSLGLELVTTGDLPSNIETLNVESRKSMNYQSGENRFFLQSLGDNPFIWLKTGYWMEQIKQVNEERPYSPDINIDPAIPADKRKKNLQPGNSGSYCQAVLTI